MSLVRRHPLITYFVLTHALAWILWLPLVVLQDTIPAAPGLVLVLLGSNVPSLLARSFLRPSSWAGELYASS